MVRVRRGKRKNDLDDILAAVFICRDRGDGHGLSETCDECK